MLHVKLKQVKSDGIASTDDSKQTWGGTVFPFRVSKLGQQQSSKPGAQACPLPEHRWWGKTPPASECSRSQRLLLGSRVCGDGGMAYAVKQWDRAGKEALAQHRQDESEKAQKNNTNGEDWLRSLWGHFLFLANCWGQNNTTLDIHHKLLKALFESLQAYVAPPQEEK